MGKPRGRNGRAHISQSVGSKRVSNHFCETGQQEWNINKFRSDPRLCCARSSGFSLVWFALFGRSVCFCKRAQLINYPWRHAFDSGKLIDRAIRSICDNLIAP